MKPTNIITKEEFLTKLEKRLRRLVVPKVKGLTTHDIIRCVKAKDAEFSLLYKKDKRCIKYYVRKILAELKDEGLITQLSGLDFIDNNFVL